MDVSACSIGVGEKSYWDAKRLNWQPRLSGLAEWRG
jgi:hypothetical protein